MKEQTRTDSLSSELSTSKQEVQVLKRELKDLRVESEKDLKLAVSELEQLGSVACSEIKIMSRTLRDLQRQRDMQNGTIRRLENKLVETTAQHKRVETELRERLSEETAKVESLMAAQNDQALGLLTLRIPEEEKRGLGESDSLLTEGNPACRSDQSTGGTDSITSFLSQGSFLERIVETKRKSGLWNKFSGGEKTDLNSLFRKNYDSIKPFQGSGSSNTADGEDDTNKNLLKDPDILQAYNALKE